MVQLGGEVRHGGGVGQLSPQHLEHGAGALGVHVNLVVLLCKLLLVLDAHHFKEVKVTIECFVFVFS